MVLSDWLTVVEILSIVMMPVVGYVMKLVFDGQKTIKDQISQLSDKLNGVAVLQVEVQNLKEDFHSVREELNRVSEIYRQIGRIEGRLDTIERGPHGRVNQGNERSH